MRKDNYWYGSGDAGDYGAMQRALLFTAHPVPILILVAKNILQTKTTQHIFGLPSSDSFRRLAPVDNLPLAVTYINTIAQAI